MARSAWRNPGFPDWESVKPEKFAEEAEKYFLRVRDFYDARARWRRRLYRLAGVVVIMLGGALPLIASSTVPGKDLVVGLLGFVVATVTALRGFYRWDTSWVLLRQTEIALTRHFFQWKTQQTPTADAPAQRASAQELLQHLLDVRAEESKAFFKDLPQLK